jgi:carboxypeptidase Taq
LGSGVAGLRELAAELADLRGIGAVLHWDQQTMMPPRGGAIRAERGATLERIAHERLTSQRTGDLIEAARAELADAPPDGIDIRALLSLEREYDKSRRVPVELAVEMARASSEGFESWQAAREADDFGLFAPALERNLKLTQDYIACFDGHEDPYDVVLDDFAPEMRTADVEPVFNELKAELSPMIRELAGREVDRSCLTVDYPIEGQRRLVARVLTMMGFEDSGWRLDDSAHPFSTGFAVGDVRLTNRYAARYFPTALYGGMHECGHGLYEAGIAPELERTPLGTIQSSVLHESQSRLWENIVGRSRSFIGAITPLVVSEAGGALDGLDASRLFRAVNAVRPQPIRLDADEATYGLHIILRFELERELLSGDLAVADLPSAWNERMRDYLGVQVEGDADGVLQDVHWSELLYGYFPTYALGSLVAAQLWDAARGDLPDLDEQLSRGELTALREWLRENVHRHGSRYSDIELLERVVGGGLAVGPFVSYLKQKLSDVYGASLA